MLILPFASACLAIFSGGKDSIMSQVPNFNLPITEITVRDTLNAQLARCPDAPKISMIKCHAFVPGDEQTISCYAETTFGYFFVSKDYLDNLNITFSRWD